MDHFSLDSVRESFAADVAAAVARAAEAARAILRALPPAPSPADGRSEEFDAAAHAFHAIKGSSSLLAIGPLTECAAELEELAARGREALDQAAERARFGRAAAEACLQGGLRLQELAQLALGHQDEALRAAARELTAHLAQLMAAAGARRGRGRRPLAAAARCRRPAASTSTRCSTSRTSPPSSAAARPTPARPRPTRRPSARRRAS